VTIEHKAPQGTPEWKQARAGCITASTFSLIRAMVGGLTEQQALYVEAIKKGATVAEAIVAASYKAKPKAASIDRALAGERVADFSDTAKALAFRLAIERISGVPLDEGYETWAMARGHELEPQARAKHEEITGDMVREVGFVTTDDGWFGASADGFRFANDNGCEYKCFISPEKLRAILLDGDITEVMDQCQGGMWLTGAKAWEFGLYCPALAPIGRDFTLIVIERDDDYIEAMERDLVAFRALVMDYEARLRAGGKPTAVPAPTPAIQAAPPPEAPPAQAAIVVNPADVPELTF